MRKSQDKGKYYDALSRKNSLYKKNCSADELIDGVTSAQENQYTFQHYYGERRDDGIAVQRLVLLVTYTENSKILADDMVLCLGTLLKREVFSVRQRSSTPSQNVAKQLRVSGKTLSTSTITRRL